MRWSLRRYSVLTVPIMPYGYERERKAKLQETEMKCTEEGSRFEMMRLGRDYCIKE